MGFNIMGPHWTHEMSPQHRHRSSLAPMHFQAQSVRVAGVACCGPGLSLLEHWNVRRTSHHASDWSQSPQDCRMCKELCRMCSLGA